MFPLNEENKIYISKSSFCDTDSEIFALSLGRKSTFLKNFSVLVSCVYCIASFRFRLKFLHDNTAINLVNNTHWRGFFNLRFLCSLSKGLEEIIQKLIT